MLGGRPMNVMLLKARTASLGAVLLYLAGLLPVGVVNAQEVVVLGSLDETIEWLQAEQWWGKDHHSDQLSAPRALITGISERWQKTANSVPVPVKKELFYRLIGPLILHANNMVLEGRARFEAMSETLAQGRQLSDAEMVVLQEVTVELRIMKAPQALELQAEGAATETAIEQVLYKLDIIPAGLALGQAAYESGYGTSRFAAAGNALFGQWTFGGEGLKPQQQRQSLGDHRIAAFEWPFDSVRGYFININSHPAYAEFRRLRAERRARGEPLSSLALADGLISYSERGQAYVDTLKSIIRVNGLEFADSAVLRDEPIRFLVGAEDPEVALEIREDIKAMRASGELDEIVERMRLD